MRPARPAARPARAIRRGWMIPAVCLVAVLTLAGCGGDDKDDDAGGTTVPTSAPGTTARPVDTRFTGEGSAEFCALITTFTTGQQDVSPTATPAELEGTLREALTAINQAEAQAPGEIKGDVVTIADTFEAVVTAMSNAGFDVAKVDSSILQSLQSQSFLDSVARLQAYLTNVCKSG